MNTRRTPAGLYIIGAALLILAFLIGPMIGVPAAFGAPSAAPTPIAQYMRNPEPRLLPFWDTATGLTADTRSSCFNIAGYSTLDLHYIIDQGTTNTTTLKLQFSNIAGAYVDGVSVVSANTSDTSGLQEYALFGDQVCLYADVANANSWSIQAVGEVK